MVSEGVLKAVIGPTGRPSSGSCRGRSSPPRSPATRRRTGAGGDRARARRTSARPPTGEGAPGSYGGRRAAPRRGPPRSAAAGHGGAPPRLATPARSRPIPRSGACPPVDPDQREAQQAPGQLGQQQRRRRLGLDGRVDPRFHPKFPRWRRRDDVCGPCSAGQRHHRAAPCSVVLARSLSRIAALGVAWRPALTRSRGVVLNVSQVSSRRHARKYPLTVCHGGRSCGSAPRGVVA